MGKKKLGKGDKLDRYRDYLLHDLPLSGEQTDMLTRYRRANTLMCEGYSRMQAMAIVAKESGLSVPQAYAIVRDSIKLFGDVNKVDKEGMRYIMYENFMAGAELAKVNRDHNAMLRALEDASRLYDLFTVAEDMIDPSLFMRPAQIMFSTDPEVLIEMQKQEAEDIDYEEAD